MMRTSATIAAPTARPVGVPPRAHFPDADDDFALALHAAGASPEDVASCLAAERMPVARRASGHGIRCS